MRSPLLTAREPKPSLEERLAKVERAYCDEFMKRIIEFELDPSNFLQEWRDRKRQERGQPR